MTRRCCSRGADAPVSLGGFLYSSSSRVVSPRIRLTWRSACARHSYRLSELVAFEPWAGLVRELEAEDVVIEANRGLEVFDGDADVM